MLLEDGRLSHPSVSANHRRKQVEARLIAEDYGCAFLERPLICKGPPCQTRVRFILLHPILRRRISLADERWLRKESWRRFVRYQWQIDARPYLGARSAPL